MCIMCCLTDKTLLLNSKKHKIMDFFKKFFKAYRMKQRVV